MISELMQLNHSAVQTLRTNEQRKYSSQYFSQHYWKEDLTGKSGNKGSSYNDPQHQRRFDFLYKNILAPHAVGRILDAGCGPGLLLERALIHEYDAVGYDISPEAQKLFRSRVDERWASKFSIGSLHDLPYQDNEFDTTICLDVLEHIIVFDVCAVIRELCRVTSGRVVCSINTDNPYEFHPTILSGDTWITLFQAIGGVEFERDLSHDLNGKVHKTYIEYDMFVFRKNI